MSGHCVSDHHSTAPRYWTRTAAEDRWSGTPGVLFLLIIRFSARVYLVRSGRQLSLVEYGRSLKCSEGPTAATALVGRGALPADATARASTRGRPSARDRGHRDAVNRSASPRSEHACEPERSRHTPSPPPHLRAGSSRMRGTVKFPKSATTTTNDLDWTECLSLSKRPSIPVECDETHIPTPL